MKKICFITLSICLSIPLWSQETFGAEFNASEAIEWNAFIEQLASHDSLETTVQATVVDVCQAKGCWMNLTGAEASEASVFVKFKDYGFFVPKDIAGRSVVVNGKAFKEMTSVEELRHYAEDKGKSKEEIEAITEPAFEYKFMASGVVLLD